MFQSNGHSTLKELGLVKYAIQQRANHLTRELHQLETHQSTVETLAERTNAGEGGVGSTTTASKQPTMDSFFQKSNATGAAARKSQVSGVVDLTKDDKPTKTNAKGSGN